jgi:hypothetical protein
MRRPCRLAGSGSWLAVAALPAGQLVATCTPACVTERRCDGSVARTLARLGLAELPGFADGDVEVREICEHLGAPCRRLGQDHALATA